MLTNKVKLIFKTSLIYFGLMTMPVHAELYGYVPPDSLISCANFREAFQVAYLSENETLDMLEVIPRSEKEKGKLLTSLLEGRILAGWIQGYTVGVLTYHDNAKLGKLLRDKFKMEKVFPVLDTYCRDNPKESVITGMHVILEKLEQKFSN